MRDALEMFSRFFTTFRMDSGDNKDIKDNKDDRDNREIFIFPLCSFLFALLLAGFNGVNGVNAVTGGLLQSPLEFLGDKRARGALGHALQERRDANLNRLIPLGDMADEGDNTVGYIARCGVGSNGSLCRDERHLRGGALVACCGHKRRIGYKLVALGGPDAHQRVDIVDLLEE